MDFLNYQKNIINLFLKSVAAVNPAKLISENLKITENTLHMCCNTYDITNKNIYVVGFGKAVLGMAAQVEKILGKHLKFGVICAPYNIQHTLKNNPEFSLKQNSVIRVYEGAENNMPDEKAVKGTCEIISAVEKLDRTQDHLIVLISGGGSALFVKPKPGISFEEKKETIKLLMKSGADIKELNTVRKKLSMVKGGGLGCLSYPVPTTCLIISDVISDPIDVIASGPTVPSSDVNSAAIKILQKYNLLKKVPESVLQEAEKDFQESCIPIKDNKFPHVDNFIIGNNQKALDASKNYATESGFECAVLSNQVKGNVKRVSTFYTKMIFQILSALNSPKQELNKEDFIKDCDFYIDSCTVEKINDMINKPIDLKKICLIAGGETTVEVKGGGKGGRNQELCLTTSVKVDDLKRKHPQLFRNYEVIFLFAGTDGQDGPTDASGAIGGPHIVEKARKHNLNISEYLLRNDSYNFFNQIDDGSSLIKIGYSGTNVMDIHNFFIYQKH